MQLYGNYVKVLQNYVLTSFVVISWKMNAYVSVEDECALCTSLLHLNLKIISSTTHESNKVSKFNRKLESCELSACDYFELVFSS